MSEIRVTVVNARDSHEVEVRGSFPHLGAAARGVTYTASVHADASEDDIRALMVHTDGVAEIQNTLREPVPVALVGVTAQSTTPGS